jgi:hypothetical protein
MLLSNDLSDLVELLNRLRAADRNFRVFGSEVHRYQLDRVMPEADLRRFELELRVELPEDYRCFVATIGNGGAGPAYGLVPLELPPWRDITLPFPLEQASDQLPADELELLGNPYSYPGVLDFCHNGCGYYTCLVVNGPARGTIWYGGDKYLPTGLSFSAWYRAWLEQTLHIVENERLVALLRVGMSKQDVVAVTGGDWQESQSSNPELRGYAASDIPARIELDEQGIVVKIVPWRFISVHP